MVLVEGVSDLVAVDTLAQRRGRNLTAEGVVLLPIGGAHAMARYLRRYGPQGLARTLAGLYDASEERHVSAALERAGIAPSTTAPLTRLDLEGLGFYCCVDDLEDELIRALGTDGAQEVLGAEGELRSFRKFQIEPAQRGRAIEPQLRRFIGTHSGRKARYARAMVDALDLTRVPRPLDLLLGRV